MLAYSSAPKRSGEVGARIRIRRRSCTVQQVPMDIQAVLQPDPAARTLEELRQAFADSLLKDRPDDRVAAAQTPHMLPVWSYRELLQAIGAVLDADTTGAINIIEVGDGFLLRRHRFRHALTEVSLTHLHRKPLRQYAQHLWSHAPRRDSRRQGFWSNFPLTHQDFFQALGSELDLVGAHHLVISELSDSLFLSYKQTGRQGPLAVTRRAVLTRSEIEELLNRPPDQRGMERAPDSGTQEPGSSLRVAPDPLWALPRSGVPYQRVLRAIGRELDRSKVGQVCLLDVPDGMAVRYQLPGDHHPIWTHLSGKQILEGIGLPQKPGTISRYVRPASSSYGDVFAALGLELERIQASDVLLLEQNDGFIVTCQYLDPRRSLTMQRGMFFVAQRELQQYQRGHRSVSALLTRLARR
jgi:hypothetical protein